MAAIIWYNCTKIEFHLIKIEKIIKKEIIKYPQ